MSSPSTAEIDKKLDEFITAKVGQILEQQVLSFTETKTHIGPLPPVEDSEQLEKAFPGFIERSLGIAEKEQQYHHGHVKRAQNHQFLESISGKIFGFLMVISLIIYGMCAINAGNTATGIITIITGAICPIAFKVIDKVHASPKEKKNKTE